MAYEYSGGLIIVGLDWRIYSLGGVTLRSAKIE